MRQTHIDIHRREKGRENGSWSFIELVGDKSQWTDAITYVLLAREIDPIQFDLLDLID